MTILEYDNNGNIITPTWQETNCITFFNFLRGEYKDLDDDEFRDTLSIFECSMFFDIAVELLDNEVKNENE